MKPLEKQMFTYMILYISFLKPHESVRQFCERSLTSYRIQGYFYLRKWSKLNFIELTEKGLYKRIIDSYPYYKNLYGEYKEIFDLIHA